MGINDELADTMTRLGLRVAQFSKSTAQRVEGILHQLELDISSLIDESGLSSATSRLEATLKTLAAQIKEMTEDAYRKINQVVGDAGVAQAEYEEGSLPRRYNGVLGVPLFVFSLAQKRLEKIGRATRVLGRLPVEEWKNQATNLYRGIVNELRIGLAGTSTTADLISRLRGVKTGSKTQVVIRSRKRNIDKRAQGTFPTAKANATTLTRSAAFAIHSHMTRLFHRQNEDLVEAIALRVTFDARTTKICISLAGGIWDTENFNPTKDSAVDRGYPGDPPYHWNCRTIVATVMKPWNLITGKARTIVEEQAKNFEKLRNKLDGQIPDDLSYEKWLRKQNKDVQLDALGPGLRSAWLNGEVKLTGLTDETLRPLTLTQLTRST